VGNGANTIRGGLKTHKQFVKKGGANSQSTKTPFKGSILFPVKMLTGQNADDGRRMGHAKNNEPQNITYGGKRDPAVLFLFANKSCTGGQGQISMKKDNKRSLLARISAGILMSPRKRGEK